MKKRIAAIILCSFICAAFTGCIQDNLESQSSIPEKTIVSAYEEQNDIILCSPAITRFRTSQIHTISNQTSKLNIL